MSSPGLEILFSSVQRDVRAPGDCIVCALHWVLVTNGYKCFGKGEQARSRREQKSELLPPGWNESQELYLLHYCHGANNFILKIVRADSALLVHLMREGDERTTSLNLHIPDYTTADWGSYNSAFTNVERLEQTIKHQLLEDFKKGVSATTSQTPAHTENRNQPHYEDDPLRVPPRHSRQPPPPHWADPRNPMSVGRGDLDPFHQGGGMVMDPFRGRGRFPPGFNPSAGMPGFLPRGAVPPGARFDPFGPPGGPSGRRPGPDPDHARRPDFDDDMYM